MENITLIFGGGVVLIFLGSIFGYFIRQFIAQKQVDSIEAKLNKLVGDAKIEAKNTLLAAKGKAVKALEEVKKEENERRRQIVLIEDRLSRKESFLDGRSQKLEDNFLKLQRKAREVREIRRELEGLREKQLIGLEKIAKLSQKEAKEELLEAAESRYKDELLERIKKLEKQAQADLEKKACDIMTLAMQRYAASQAADITTTTVSLPSDDLKGRIIGKEGRNIKTLEKLTGVEIVVDDTPEAIVVSSFDPIRRQVAKMALEKLMADGRIQPARIEETVERAKAELARKIEEAGQAAVYDTGVVGLDPRLIKLLGRLRFRTSFGQNVLLHSIEVAHLASMIASELGLDASLAKKAGLLHDIGKAVDHEVEGSHVEIGRSILGKFGIEEEVIKAMQSHHEEYPFENNEAMVIQAADTLSSSRPGARKDTLENYLKRLEELEEVANSFAEVEKSYAIQAGREIRVFVSPEKIDDLGALKLARQIADKIEQRLKYPGEIKVNVIRETRAVEYAR